MTQNTTESVQSIDMTSDINQNNPPPDAAPAEATAESATDQVSPPPVPESGAASEESPGSPAPIELDTVLGVAETLSESERAEFVACEAVIAGGWQAFVEVGLALARIRDARLYRVEYDTFESYCKAKWEYGARYVYRLISAAELVAHLRTICSHRPPDHESQVRPLMGLTPEEAQLAWTCAVETAGGRKITARLVKRAMQDLGLAAPPQPVSKINRNAKAERRKLINDTIGQLLLLISQKAGYDAILHHVEALQRHIQPLLQDQRRPAAPGDS
ncbi:MAG: hypothetical protein AB9869_01340 [Verrucomicrobiia bacterium]